MPASSTAQALAQEEGALLAGLTAGTVAWLWFAVNKCLLRPMERLAGDAQLLAATEAEAKFLSFMSHDLRNNLNGVTLALELLKHRLTGLPAISVCAGYGAAGLPLSIQLVGKAFQEQTIFRAAHAYETATAWRDRRPPMAS